jgi:hypothetical protein
MSNVGRLTTTGDGGMVLASCFTHGVQRYDSSGHNDGSYHLGGTASHAIPDFAGRHIAVATVEGELAVINGAGNVRWKTVLPRPACAVELDALGRYLVYGLPTGEITRIDLEKSAKGARSRSARATPTVHSAREARPGPIRAPSWTVPVAQTDLQAETAVVAVLDEPPLIGFLTGRNHLQILTGTGEVLGHGPELLGPGRLLRTTPGWIAACTDRQVAMYDAKRNTIQRLDVVLAELTHLELRPETYGLALVQERDRLGRVTPAGRWIWKRELKSPVEDLAIGPGGATAVTTDNGQLLIFDAAGVPSGQFSATEAEALCLVEAPQGSPANVAWITLARRFQTLLGHDLNGRVVWQSPIPWQGWDLLRLDTLVVVTTADGRGIAFDGAGQVKAQSREGDTLAVYAEGAGQEPWLAWRQGVHLICVDMQGRVHWRAVADATLGPMAAGRTGVAVMIGRSLAWFPAAETPKI